MDTDLIQALVGLLEAKDSTTASHTWRVVLYTRALAEAAGVDRATIGRLTYGAALHDVGKIDIADKILAKPGPLTPDEFEAMKTHTVLGHQRLLRMEERDPLVLELVLHHHERWDGRGYPDGLAGDQIPLGPRYFAVIDSFDAMTSVRPYRAEIGHGAAELALAEIEAGASTRYCQEAVALFGDLFKTGKLDWILEHFNDSCPVPSFHELARLDRHRMPQGS